jgi:hypothetical protein
MMVSILKRIEQLVEEQPGLTQSELAKVLFGAEEGYQQRVNEDCRLLVARGTIEQRGQGGNADPYRYYRK